MISLGGATRDGALTSAFAVYVIGPAWSGSGVRRSDMPAKFIIHPDHRLVVSSGTGVFRHADFLWHMARLAEDPEFNPEFNHLVDCRGFASLDLTTAQIEDLACRSIFDVRSRRAFVVASDLQFALSRVYAAYWDVKARQEVMVYRDLREAVAWLALPPGF